MGGLRISIFISALCLFMGSGCGGGTTGTSPTNDLRFSGFIIDENGMRITNAEMTVSSVGSGRVLVASSTDKEGGFAMTLPSGEDVLSIELPTVSDAETIRGTLTRKIQMPSTFRTTLVVSPGIGVTGVAQEEVRVVAATCHGAETTPYDVDLRAVPAGSPCSIKLTFASKALNHSGGGVGRVEGLCGSEARYRTLSEFSAPDGVFSVDVSSVLTAPCKELRIMLFASRSSEAGVIVPLLR